LEVKAAPLTTSESAALDVVRITAAAVVAAGHLTLWHFSSGWPDLSSMGKASVGVFFVLSGFVIRYVTCRRRDTLGSYARDRASRIYSVAIPALLFTIVADAISRHVNPGLYSVFARGQSVRHVVENLLFTAQLWSPTRDSTLTAPLSNLPFWSLNYEVLYYVLYGLAFYLSGWRRWLGVGVMLLAVGPRVLYLAPLWLAGCLAHDVYQRWNASGKTARNLDWLLAGCVAFAAALLVATRVSTRLSEALRHGQAYLIAKDDRIPPKDYLFGLLGTIVFLRLLVILRRIEISPDSRTVWAIEFISEGTFPLYLLHFPLLVLIAACVPYDHGSAWQKILVFFAVFAVGVLAGHPCNKLKMKMRKLWRSPEARPKVSA
jgi:peptidoglycan/LPS O-acetylase OafA/YrhL